MDSKSQTVTSQSLHFSSPIGLLKITGSDKGILGIEFCDQPAPAAADRHPTLAECRRQLDEYFQGRRRRFDLPLDLRGTPFQKMVWGKLLEIPFGQTRSYAAVARAIGRTNSQRAVGGANHRNPVSIVVPCHRVIGSNGQLTGFGGGLWRKQWLLEHEKKTATRS
jgi:methylated-DNA-[protein]-cysteine S-methyltransferase